MAKTRVQKEQQLAEIEEFIQGKAVVLTGYSRLTVKELTDLRNKLRQVDTTYRVIKTALLRKVLVEKGIKIPNEILKSQLAVAASKTDEIEPSKTVVEFAKANENLEIFGAVIDAEFVDNNQVKTLASLPSKPELYGQLLGSLVSPLSGLVNVLGGNIRGLVYLLNQYKEQKVNL